MNDKDAKYLNDALSQARARIAVLEAALLDLVEAADSMKATYGFVRGETQEHDDTCLHEKWAEGFLQERADAARAALSGQPAEPRLTDAEIDHALATTLDALAKHYRMDSWAHVRTDIAEHSKLRYALARAIEAKVRGE